MSTQIPASARSVHRDTDRDAALLEGQRRVLQLLARGAPLDTTLTTLCEFLEERLPQAMCSVLLLDAQRGTLHHGAAPRLARAYCEAINGVHIGPAVGSCGTAAFEHREVMVEDIAHDPLWKDYAQFALPHGLAACASVPILNVHRDVLGTFAIYHRDPGPFSERELELLRDVTGLATVAIEAEQRRAALRDSEERFRIIAEQTGQVIYDAHVGMNDTMLVGAVEATLGHSADELRGVGLEGWLAYVEPDDRERVRRELERGGEPNGRRSYRIEYRARRADGTVRNIEQRGVTLMGDDGRPARYYGVVADVTEQRRTEDALRQAQKLDSLGVLAGGIAHDFNNLLTAMIGNVNLAEMSLSPVSPAMEYLENLESAVLRAADLTKQMLAYSGKGSFVIKPLDLSQVVREMTHLLSVTLPKKVSIRYELSDSLPPIEADVAQIQQVVMNLVTNAAEAIGDGPGTVIIGTDCGALDAAYIATNFVSQAVEPGMHVILEVSDTGAGMTPDVMARMFDPFFTTKASGRGLGLSAMLGILRTHRAGIKVYSEPGKGSTFRLFFPASGAHERVPSVAPTQVQPVARGGLALVVDDEREIRRTASEMLRLLGFQVLEAGDGIEALEHVAAHGAKISVVLMDLTMPRMGGKEAFNAIRAREPSIPVILCSGYNQQEAIQSFLGKGLAGFLQKPYQLKELERAVGEAVTAKRAT